ncbi:hypothetical protein KM043_013724 [Ampulex compressa]|nr:hypothetical protein KM043_013724 [Ampulex compressa]
MLRDSRGQIAAIKDRAPAKSKTEEKRDLWEGAPSEDRPLLVTSTLRCLHRRFLDLKSRSLLPINPALLDGRVSRPPSLSPRHRVPLILIDDPVSFLAEYNRSQRTWSRAGRPARGGAEEPREPSGVVDMCSRGASPGGGRWIGGDRRADRSRVVGGCGGGRRVLLGGSLGRQKLEGAATAHIPSSFNPAQIGVCTDRGEMHRLSRLVHAARYAPLNDRLSRLSPGHLEERPLGGSFRSSTVSGGTPVRQCARNTAGANGHGG